VTQVHPTAIVDAAACLEESVEIGPYCIIGPNVELGERTRLASHVVIEGHTRIGPDCIVHPFVNLGGPPQHTGHRGEPTRLVVGARNVIRGLAAAHQNTRIGRHAFVGGMAGVNHDVIPFGNVWGNHAHLEGLNLVGLKRRGFPREVINTLRGAYRMLFAEEGTFQERLDDTAAAFAYSPEVMEIVAFIRADASRPITTPQREI
jgi:UDP-N-acetylglucosamine acyltransferase